MDEILASIRRIIEGGEEAGEARAQERRPAVERLPDGGGAGNLLARLRPATGPSAEDGGLAPETGKAAAKPVAENPNPVPMPRDWLDDEDDLASRLADELASEDLMCLHERAANEPLSPARPETGASAPSGLMEEAAVAPAFVPANSDDRHMSEFRKAVIDDALGPERPEPASLVSTHTGELVGASFDELAEAIREGHLRSIEEMAQDILRPMLREWLDDNLPRLVERLVREEIERVARGNGRR